VVYSRDIEEVGVAQEMKSPKNQCQIFQTKVKQYWLGKNKPKKLSDRFLKIIYLMKFSSD